MHWSGFALVCSTGRVFWCFGLWRPPGPPVLRPLPQDSKVCRLQQAEVSYTVQLCTSRTHRWPWKISCSSLTSSYSRAITLSRMKACCCTPSREEYAVSSDLNKLKHRIVHVYLLQGSLKTLALWLGVQLCLDAILPISELSWGHPCNLQGPKEHDREGVLAWPVHSVHSDLSRLPFHDLCLHKCNHYGFRILASLSNLPNSGTDR